MKQLSDFIPDVSPREREQLDKQLKDGESLRWAARPRPSLRSCVQREIFVFSLLWVAAMFMITSAMLGCLPESMQPTEAIAQLREGAWMLVLFWLIGLSLLFSPYYTRWKRSRRLCLLTNERALVLEHDIFGWRCYAWELDPYLLLMRSPADRSLYFSQQVHIHPNFICEGFENLPDAREAEQHIFSTLAERGAKGRLPEPTGKTVEDFLPDLNEREKQELALMLFPDEKNSILWAGRSLSGLVLGGWKDILHILTGDHHLWPQLYVLTWRRALMLQPQYKNLPWKYCAYPVQPDMVVKRRQREQGRGDIIFEAPRGENGALYKGFMNLADMLLVERDVERAVAAWRLMNR